MPDHREELAGNLHISSPTLTYQTHTRHESEGDREFSFWNSSSTIPSENDCNQLGSNEARLSLNSKAEFGETYKRNTCKFEHSPFLHCSHHFSSLSDPSRSKAIAEGRMELMEMMQDMPESSYELSFQDMVVEQQEQSKENETSLDNTLMQSSSNKDQLKKLNKKKKTKSNRQGQIMRVESMDSETFLLKMFFPTSLTWTKKVKVENGSKVAPRSPLQESIKQVSKDWIVKRFFLAGDNREGCNTSSSSDKSRYFDRNFSFSHGCWPFFRHKESKTKKLGG